MLKDALTSAPEGPCGPLGPGGPGGPCSETRRETNEISLIVVGQ